MEQVSGVLKPSQLHLMPRLNMACGPLVTRSCPTEVLAPEPSLWPGDTILHGKDSL
jgi:hypothetical protein